ncbi:MAG TPA: xanthine dehydrogenase family protein molybdopterin-binding subunit [Jatrophihabitans sp.]|uniref:xanthine dehydrogenase family protein molybdopterin-binding subunit n=1 Tax=Jatrophihabitans sp. TaxID=1932789 RepID=UPI002DFCBA0D|nr:xanthine dehydrogenase family protein molybdopterin-binding subunit [Jatrophihabitans sp.]
MSILGTRVVRTEDPGFLTRGATYTEDVVDDRLAGALHVTFVRSPIAHAKISSIDTAAAASAPGVVAVFTAADLADDAPAQKPQFPMFPAAMAQPLLAIGTVRYVGEAVAVVITEEKYQGEDAAEQVEVDYDPLPAVVDPREALRDETLLFPDAGTNVAFTVPVESSDTFFDGCAVVVEHEIVNQRVAVAPLEVRAGAAVWIDGRLTMWCPNQGAQGSKAGLARALGLEPDLVRIITPDVGGAFGAKFGVDPEHSVVALAARKVGRPVRWVETRSENMLAMTHGRGQVQTVSIGGNRDGRVAAYRLGVLQEAGAYARIGTLLPSLTALMAPGVYDIERIEVSARSVVTNTTPMGAYRGAGRPEATAAIERAMDLFAAELGLDPAEVRRVNLRPPFTEPLTTVTGAKYDSGAYEEALDRALAAAGYADLRAEQAKRRESGDPVQLGIGVCTYVEITGGGDESGPPNENATVEVHPDGSATILTGTSPHGQGHQTVWAMLASEELGIPMDRITVKWGDTDLVPKGGGTGGSRSLQQGGAAVQQASQELVELAKERAAAVLEVDPGDLVLDTERAGLVVAGVPDTGISFAQLAEREPLLVQSVFSAPGATYPFGAHVAVAEVDVESGKAVLTRLVAVDDAGTVLNPLLAEGQRHGGLAQGAAQALLEEVLYDEDGNPTTATLADYGFLSATEVPSFELVDMATPTSYNPLGAKGIGEAGTIGATPAVQSAVIDAVAHLGVRHIDMPTTPHRVWKAIQTAAARGAEN